MSRLLENGLKSVNPRGYQGGQGWLWWALTSAIKSPCQPIRLVLLFGERHHGRKTAVTKDSKEDARIELEPMELMELLEFHKQRMRKALCFLGNVRSRLCFGSGVVVAAALYRRRLLDGPRSTRTETFPIQTKQHNQNDREPIVSFSSHNTVAKKRT
jgi:hypothetical protein